MSRRWAATAHATGWTPWSRSVPSAHTCAGPLFSVSIDSRSGSERPAGDRVHFIRVTNSHEDNRLRHHGLTTRPVHVCIFSTALNQLIATVQLSIIRNRLLIWADSFSAVRFCRGLESSTVRFNMFQLLSSEQVTVLPFISLSTMIRRVDSLASTIDFTNGLLAID